MMPVSRSAKALARKVVTTQRVRGWHLVLDGNVIGYGPVEKVGRTKEDAVAWSRRQFPHIHDLEVRSVP